MNPSVSIPDRLPVLPLPYPLVLHPHLLLSVNITYAHALSLLKVALQNLSSSDRPKRSRSRGTAKNPADANKPILIACVPISKAPLDSHSADSKPTIENHYDDVFSYKRPPADVDREEKIHTNDWFSWGCSAKLVRLNRNPHTQTCTLLLSGMTRIRIDRYLSVRAPLTPSTTTLDPSNNSALPGISVPLAAITSFTDDESWPSLPEASPAEMDLVVRLKKASEQLIDAIANLSPPSDPSSVSPYPMVSPGLPLMPVSLLKKLNSFIQECRESQAALLADIVLGTLGGACEWSSRVSILADWDQKVRIQNATRTIENGVKRVKLARELLMTLSSPFNANNKEVVIRSQLEALLNQLAALNQGVAARINAVVTGSSNDQNDDRKVGGIITIQSPLSRDSVEQNKPTHAISKRNPFSSRGGPLGGSNSSNTSGMDDDEDEIAPLSRKLDDAQLSVEARKTCDRELKRLARIPPQSVERGVIITYLEIMAELPWEKISDDLGPKRDFNEKAPVLRNDENVQQLKQEGIVDRARRIFDEDHYGLEKVKKRLVEYLAVLELKTGQALEKLEADEAEQERQTAEKHNSIPAAVTDDALSQQSEADDDRMDNGDDEEMVSGGQGDANEQQHQHKSRLRRNAKLNVGDKGPILLLVGPPGTGKTSIARSLASALQRPFTRLSLGGVRDEAEIRGHRRTYVGAMPGSIVSALRKVGVSDPVILLDEVDKLGSGNGLHGDPMAAMLEVLDPEQNHTFTDHYINVPIDLSRVLFIATANTLDTLSPPLLDRTEVIHISGYTHDEKTAIARQYLLPKQTKAQGLKCEQLVVSDQVLLKIAMSYTREAGVRTLERQVGALARAKAVEYSQAKKGTLTDTDGNKIRYDPVVELDDLEKYLGPETYEPEVAETEARAGVSTGLAYQGSGSGGILQIESIMLPPSNGHLKLTGSLGDVIRESAEIALSWVKAHAFQLGIIPLRESEFPKNDIHLHLPSGAIPKDGPSAGVAMICAFVSLFTKTPLSPYLAMTGEVTLRGTVLPVGGIREKLTAASRAGIRQVLLPIRNRKDVEADLPKKVKEELEIKYVGTVWEALELAFGKRLFENAGLTLETHDGIRGGKRLMHEIVSSRM